MTQPFCCDITSGTKEEQNEFKRLFSKATKSDALSFRLKYYGMKNKGFLAFRFEAEMIGEYRDISILPLSEGILILKKMVGEEEKAEINEAIEFGEWLRTFDSLDKKNGFWILESQISTKDLYDGYLADRENWRNLQPKPTE